MGIDYNDTFHSQPSPTNDTETLGQTEQRIEHELTAEVAQGGVATSTAIEATEVWASDPAVATEFDQAVADGRALGTMLSAADPEDDDDEDDNE